MALTEEERILSFIREHGSINRSKCEELLSVPEARVKYILRKMLVNRLVRMEGKKKGAKYAGQNTPESSKLAQEFTTKGKKQK